MKTVTEMADVIEALRLASIARRAASPPGGLGLDHVEGTTGALWVYSDIRGTLLLHPRDGVLCCEHNRMSVRPETDPKWIDIALKCAADHHPELRALLPDRPADAIDCPVCGGSGNVPVQTADFMCGVCLSLGWCPPGTTGRPWPTEQEMAAESAAARARAASTKARDVGNARKRRAVTVLIVLIVLATVGAIVAFGQAETRPTGRMVPQHGLVEPGPVSFCASDPTLMMALDGEREITIWRLRPPAAALKLAQWPANAKHAVISADGTFVVAACADGVVRSWNIDGSVRPTRFATSAAVPSAAAGVEAVALAPDGKHVATIGADGMVWLWTPDGAWIGTHGPCGDKPTAGTSIAFSPDGKFVAATDRQSLRIWSVAGGVVASPSRPPTSRHLLTLAWSPAGDCIATEDGEGSDGDDTIDLWNVDGSRRGDGWGSRRPLGAHRRTPRVPARADRRVR